VLIEIPEPDPRGYTEILSPVFARRAVKLALYAVLEDDRSCHPPLASRSQ
jgi:hypothetical protein